MDHFEVISKIILASGLGALAGFFAGRARTCSGQVCNVRATMVFSVISGAFLGAVVAWYFTSVASEG